MYKATIAIGIVAAACVVIGCGSSSDETAEAAVTKAQFIKQAEAICSKTQEQGRKARIAWEQENGEELDFHTAFKYIIGPSLEKQAEELESLQAPKGDEARLARMTANLSRGAAGFTAAGTKSKTGSKFEAFQREAEAYGLVACRI